MDAELDLENRIIAALRRIIRAVDVHSRRLAQETGVTGPQLLALRSVARLGPGPIGMLAKAMHVSHATFTDILARLEARGLVERKRDGSDRRRVEVRATASGRHLAETAPPGLQDRFRRELGAMAEWERTQLLASLQRIAWMMDAEEIEASPVLTATDVPT